MIVLISGYANSGKTTLLDYFSSQVSIYSTSQILHQFVEKTIYELSGLLYDSTNKNNEIVITCQSQAKACKRTYLNRDLHITVAESILKKHLGQTILVQALIAQLQQHPCHKNCLVETIGGDEADFIIEKLTLANLPFKMVNIRSELEVIGCDCRQLLPLGLDIQNDLTAPTTNPAYQYITNLLT
ncbi:MAG: hypothetical protein ACRC2V_21925 [Xenococcaceae cyanobacterium]